MIVKEVRTKKERREFFKFPLKLYKGNPYAVPQLISDEDDEFNPEVNDAYSYAESKMFLCYDDSGKIAGRIAAIHNKAYNAKQNVKQLRFTRYDVIDDFAVTEALFEPVKAWANELGMDEIVGPIGFSDLDKQGMLVEGFDRDDMYLTIYNYPYYVSHMEKLGMKKAADWVEYRIAVPTEPDERLYRIADMVKERSGFEYYEIKSFKSVEKVIHRALKEIMNEVFAHLYGVVEITDRQIKREADMLKQVWVNDFVTAVKNREGEVIGYGFMAPSVSKAMRKMNGKITLGGVFQLMHDQSSRGSRPLQHRREERISEQRRKRHDYGAKPQKPDKSQGQIPRNRSRARIQRADSGTVEKVRQGAAPPSPLLVDEARRSSCGQRARARKRVGA